MTAIYSSVSQLRNASQATRTTFSLIRPSAICALHQALPPQQLSSSIPRRSFGRRQVMTKADGEPKSFTTVPKAKTDEEAVTGALALAHDCYAAYSQAAGKAKDPELKQALEKFASQADGQIDQWRGLLNPPPEKETGISTALNAGKVKLAQLAGDKAIVKAIFNNSNDSYTAYSEVAKRSDFSKSTTGLARKLAPEAEAARAFFEKWQAAQS